MKRRALGVLSASLLLAAAAAAQQPAEYLDVLIVKVKPEKRVDFDALGKKVADANRRNKGDTWVAMESVYGEEGTVTFISQRSSYGDVEKALQTFDGAMKKAFGEAGAQKLGQDFNAMLANARAELRRRRWDLSYNAPSDAAAFSKMVGESRWVRTIAVHVRPGHGPAFEEMIKDLNAARQKASSPITVVASQSDTGQQGTVYYLSRLVKSLSELDGATPLPQLLGEEGYQKFLKTNAESVAGVETYINRFLPELSNAPEQVAATAPEFWTPKPKAAAKAKPKAPEGAKPEAKPSQ